MLIARDLPTLADARATLARSGRALALVPTMGALHDGHLSIVDAAGRDGSAVAVSIFVNPLQFGDASDLARYPVDHAGDLARLERAGCALAWLPGLTDIYPDGHATTVGIGRLGTVLEGASRPGHFDGVATVVSILFNRLRPDCAWFGEKDWQQLQVIRQLVRDVSFDVEIRSARTRREPDGLAMSSRNRFLAPDERERAASLHRALVEAAERIVRGDAVAAVLSDAVRDLSDGGFETDYVELVDGATLAPQSIASRGSRLLAAAILGSVRLLDNEGLDWRGSEPR